MLYAYDLYLAYALSRLCVRYSDIQLRSLPRALDLRAIAPCVLDISCVSSVPPYTYRHGYLCRYIVGRPSHPNALLPLRAHVFYHRGLPALVYTDVQQVMSPEWL